MSSSVAASSPPLKLAMQALYEPCAWHNSCPPLSPNALSLARFIQCQVAEVFEASEFHHKVAERLFHTAAQPTKSLQYSKALVRDEVRLALLRKVSRLNWGLCITSDECIDTS